MSVLNPKIFLPLCAAGIITGYMAAEYIVPKYFHPTPDTKLTVEDIFRAIGDQPNYFRQTLAGNYLSGQYAQRHKDWDMAHEYMQRVARKDKTSADIQKHNMVLSMASGDALSAIEAARDVLKTDPQDILAMMFASLGHFKNGNYEGVKRQLSDVGDNNVAAFIVPVLEMWADTAEKKLSIDSLIPNSFYGYQALLAGEYIGNHKPAVKFAMDSFKLEEVDLRDLEKYADIFALYDKSDKALELYKLVKKHLGTNKELTNKIYALEKNQPAGPFINLPEINSPQEGAAYVYLDMAEILMREKSDDSATIFAQMALYLNPKLYSAHSIIAEVYQRSERGDDAIKALQNIPQGNDLYILSQRKIAEIYATQENNTKAIEILQGLYDTTQDIDALVQIGDIHRYEENYEAAVETYNKVFAITGEPTKDEWHILYARGMALERLKKFPEAEADLQQALGFRPDNPYLLNYLGYSWVDQGIKLEESLEMISKAVAMLPRDGYITDSLGWAYYKMKDFEKAVPFLERAVELLPYDATINDHLGDAYWQVGRKNEAKFQWQRALNYIETPSEEEELKEKLTLKLVSGLDALPAKAINQTGDDE